MNPQQLARVLTDALVTAVDFVRADPLVTGVFRDGALVSYDSSTKIATVTLDVDSGTAGGTGALVYATVATKVPTGTQRLRVQFLPDGRAVVTDLLGGFT